MRFLKKVEDLYDDFMYIIIAFGFLMIFLLYSPNYAQTQERKFYFDCNSLNVTKFEFQDGKLFVNAHLFNFLELTHSWASFLFSIVISSGKIKTYLNQSHFLDFVYNDSNISFVALTSVGGNINANLLCNDAIMKTTSTNLETIKYYPFGTTAINPSQKHLFEFSDGCINSRNFEIFEIGTMSFPSFNPFLNITYETNVNNTFIDKIPLTLTQSENSESIRFLDQIQTLILSNESSFPTFDILLPILDDYEENLPEQKFEIYTRGNTEFIKSILDSPKIIVKNGSRCFRKAAFAKTLDGKSPLFSNSTQEIRYSFLNYWFSNPSLKKLRSFFSDVSKPNLKEHPNFPQITFENTLSSQRIKEIQQIFSSPFNNITLNMNPKQIANILGETDIYVVCSLPGLLLSGFLKENSTIVMINPDGNGKQTFSKTVAKNLGLHEYTVPGPFNYCSNVKCMVNTFEWKQTKNNAIISTLQEVISKYHNNDF